MTEPTIYDVVITGGGLAGLSLAIQLASQGYQVVLLEKDQYPMHRVCGEYISRESWDFLVSLGVDLHSLQVSQVTRLELTTSKGRRLNQPLPLGGFGVSRYQLDFTLAGIARNKGVTLLENTKTTGIEFNDGYYSTATNEGVFISRMACGSFGKRSNVDMAWNRPFITTTRNPLNNFIGIKYHVRGDFENDTVFLHLFKKGYAGLVKIEADLYNLCYLTAASNLKASGNSIDEMERRLLSQNPAIKDLFDRAVKTDPRPVTISQISFETKSTTEYGVPLVGDAAGMITPLCGNGMSMALHGSKIAARLVTSFLEGKMTGPQLEAAYTKQWKHEFGARMRMGRGMQRALSIPWLASLLVGAGTLAPPLIRQLIRRTHGQPF